METPVRILFASSEVAPFAKHSGMAKTVRMLPEQLQEDGSFESRIMMPRYGTISERRNRLHEVIRLSGSKIAIGDQTEVLKVKVASIPGIRLQVYFMDNPHFFKRKGIYESNKLGCFEDNLQRALFFARSVLQTTRNLGWSPDVIHAHGWLSALLPVVLRYEYADDDLFDNVKVVYSSDGFTSDERFAAADLAAYDLPIDNRLMELDLSEVGSAFADASVYGGGVASPGNGAFELNGESDTVTSQATTLYSQVLAEGDVLA